MVYRITGGIFIGYLALTMLGVPNLSNALVGIIGIIAAIALLAGF